MEEKDYAKEYGLRYKQIRQAKGLSQQALADLMHVTPQAVSKWEKEGYADFNYLEGNLYGLSADRISNEVFKLERIGLVVREMRLKEGLFDDEVEDLISGHSSLQNQGLSARLYRDFCPQSSYRILPDIYLCTLHIPLKSFPSQRLFLNLFDYLLFPYACTVLNRFSKSVTIPGSSNNEMPKHFFPASFMDAPMW
ncbi:MAG: helix-turn-helix transcriptional regulator [Lachnospiraceae bacterium]|nr:helix-turn-helix transcriptional regulator [Lachnospiraceae bacterium]MBQ8948086.1 helix-turn-helix transcriptional regulator [Lachnospiraceae bacterium]